LVKAPRLDLAAAREHQGDALAVGHVADLGEVRAGLRHGPPGALHGRGRQGDEQLVILSAGGRQLERGAFAAGHGRDAVGNRYPVKVDLQPVSARPRDVPGVRAEPVADVDHRRRSRTRQREPLAEARSRIELAGDQGIAQLRGKGAARPVAAWRG